MQVYCNDRYVGDLNRKYQDDVRQINLHFMEAPAKLFYDEGEMLTAPVTRSVVFDVKRRAVSIPLDWRLSDSEQQKLIRHSRQRFNIPDDAKAIQHKDPMTGDTECRFYWKAIEVPLDTYEEHLFDHYEFEPC